VLFNLHHSLWVRGPLSCGQPLHVPNSPSALLNSLFVHTHAPTTCQLTGLFVSEGTKLGSKSTSLWQSLDRPACAFGLEGIVSKRRDARYRSGRSLTWLKVKNPDYER